MDENKLDFFGDIKDKLVLIAVGLLSMATIVPLFINNVSKVFHLSIGFSYGVFTVFYFVLPLVFFAIYYFSINQGVDLHGIKTRSKKEILAGSLALILAIGFYFIYPVLTWLDLNKAYKFWIVYTILINLFIVASVIAVIRRACMEGSRGTKNRYDPNQNKKKILFIEFFIVGGCIMFLFGVLYLSNWTSIKTYLYSKDYAERAVVSFTYYGYGKDLDTIATKFKSLEDTSYEALVIASLNQDLALQPNAGGKKGHDGTVSKKTDTVPVKKYTLKEITQEDSLFNALVILKSDTASDDNKKKIQLSAQGLKQDVAFGPLFSRLKVLDDSLPYATPFKLSFDNILKRKLKTMLNRNGADIIHSYLLFKQAYYMKDYARNITGEGHEKVKEKWVALLRQLKYKGLQWMLLLLMLSLYWWLHLNYRLADLLDATETKETQTDEKKGAGADSGEAVAVRQSISQIKSFIYVLLLLVLPFFKHIDKDDVNLDRPFLNFGVAGLSGQGAGWFGGSPDNNDSTGSSNDQREATILLKDIDKNVGAINAKLDSGSMNGKFENLNNEIYDVAHQTIGSQKRLEDFEKKHPHLPKQ